MIDHLTAEYNAEKARIERNRLLLWSSAKVQVRFGKLSMLPLTLRAWTDLRASGNAFFGDADPTFDDVFAYVWRNCEEYTPNRSIGTFFTKWRIKRRLSKADFLDCFEAINLHMQQAFDEVPETASNGGYSRSSAIEGVDPITCAIDELAHRYGENPRNVADWPLAVFFSLQKATRVATIPKYKPLAPAGIRRISGKILEAING